MVDIHGHRPKGCRFIDTMMTHSSSSCPLYLPQGKAVTAIAPHPSNGSARHAQTTATAEAKASCQVQAPSHMGLGPPAVNPARAVAAIISIPR